MVNHPPALVERRARSRGAMGQRCVIMGERDMTVGERCMIVGDMVNHPPALVEWRAQFVWVRDT